MIAMIELKKIVIAISSFLPGYLPNTNGTIPAKNRKYPPTRTCVIRAILRNVGTRDEKKGMPSSGKKKGSVPM
jgi:hypothetical protein